MAEIEVPEWLTADFLKSCLESDPENFPDVTIKEHKFQTVVAEGNNYGSLLLRVKIKYNTKSSTNQSISLIVKAPLLKGYVEQFLEIMPNLYKNEPTYYGEFIKETYKLINHDLVPKFYSTPNPLCVVLEDLNTSGYVMVDRHKLLDFDHCKLYIEASSKLHAFSIAINETNPELIQSLTKCTPEMEKTIKESFKGMTSLGLKSMTAFLKDKPECGKYVEVIRQLDENDNYWNIYEEADKGEKPLTAMIQNDPWCTNMMFKYDASGKVVCIKLIDFQGLKFNSPVMEFITFLWVSVNPEVRETRINDLYHLYCNSLNQNLEELGCSQRLPFEAMKQELVRLSPIALAITCFMMPFCVADGAADMNALLSETSSSVSIEESSLYKLYTGKVFSKYGVQIMNQLDKEGIFDYLREKIK